MSISVLVLFLTMPMCVIVVLTYQPHLRFFSFRKADYNSIIERLSYLHKDMDSVWTMFKKRLTDLINAHISTKTIKWRKDKKAVDS